MRKPLAGLVVLLVSTMTSWVSACDLACFVQRFHSGCAVDQGMAAPSSASASSDAPMANMSMPESSTAAQLQHDSNHFHDNSCAHNPCNEASVSAISKAAPHAVRV